MSPAELEVLLLNHPHVSEAAVCALWNDHQSTEVPIAYITLSPAAEQYEGVREELLLTIKMYVDEQVAPYKRLRGGVHVIEEIPKTGSGKVLRRSLPARLKGGREGKL